MVPLIKNLEITKSTVDHKVRREYPEVLSLRRPSKRGSRSHAKKSCMSSAANTLKKTEHKIRPIAGVKKVRSMKPIDHRGVL